MLSRRDTTGFLLLVLAVAAGLTLRVAGTLEKRTIEHDEALSYLTAAGHIGTFRSTRIEGGEQVPAGRWVRASAWKQFLQVDNTFCFKQIGKDAADHSNHPPLYFWLLHIWMRGFGTNLWTGLSLNFVIFLFTTFVLFKFAHYLLEDIFEASFVVLLWALSPATIVTSLMARMYDLLTLLTVLFAWLTIRYVYDQKKPERLHLLFLAIVVCTGALTHYQFLIIVLPAGVLLAVLKLARGNLKQLFLFMSSIILGCLIAFIVHPNFYHSFHLNREYITPFDVQELPLRILVTAAGFGCFFTAILQRITDGGLLLDPTHSTPLTFRGTLSVLSYNDLIIVLVVVLILLSIGWSACFRLRAGGGLARFRPLWDSPAGGALWFGLCLAGAIIIQYLSFLLVKEALRERYLSIVWPFFALGLVFVVRHTGRKVLFITLLIALFLLLSVNEILHFRSVNTRLADAQSIFEKSSTLVIDTFQEGKLLPVLWNIPDDKMVFIASQKYLLENSEQWLGRLLDQSIIVSVLSYGATLGDQERIVGMAATRCRVSALNVAIWRWTSLFQVDSCDKSDGHQ
jgi:uncharacterized membrane protein